MIASPAWQLMFDDPELELALRRIVHGDQRFDYRRPLRAGDVVQRHPDHRQGPGPGRQRDHLLLGRRSPTLTGETVCTATATFVHSRGERGMTAPRAELEVGTALPPLTVRFTREQLVRYAGASGDFNPIHFSDHFARASACPGWSRTAC